MEVETPNKLKTLSNDSLAAKLRDLSQRDLKLTAEIISHIREFMCRRLFLDHGSTSMFGYLVDTLGYPRATAQNRIDAARLLGDVPEIGEDLARGKINLGQITLMAMGVRQVEKENPGLKVSPDQKRELVEKLKATKPPTDKLENGTCMNGSRVELNSMQLIAAELNIKVSKTERVRIHQDGSVTLEVHLSKEEFEDLKRVRELNSHRNHDAKLGETVAEAAKFFLHKKDPLKLKSKTFALEISSSSNLNANSVSPSVSRSSQMNIQPRGSRKYISAHTVRAIHQHDRSCRWIDSSTGKVCGSTFQLQLDHIRGIANGGGNEIENLELKCAVHNRHKFELELQAR